MEQVLSKLGAFGKHIDFSDPVLWASAAHIVLNPLFWNVAARLEYRRHPLTRLFGSARRGCYFLAVVIFGMGLTRDALFSYAVSRQPSVAAAAVVSPLAVQCIGYALYAVGLLLVLTSTYQLGIVGTYLGDYFGILMEKRVTAFPFSLFNSPMYDGSVLNFVGHAVLHRSPAGLLLACLVFLVYKVALRFEDSFTAFIYEHAAKKNQKKQQQQQQQKPKSPSPPVAAKKASAKKAKQH